MKRKEILNMLLEDLEMIPLTRTSYEELKQIATQMHFKQVDQFLSEENLKLKTLEIPLKFKGSFNSVDRFFLYIVLASEFEGKFWKNEQILELSDGETRRDLGDFIDTFRINNLKPQCFADICSVKINEILSIYNCISIICKVNC